MLIIIIEKSPKIYKYCTLLLTVCQALLRSHQNHTQSNLTTILPPAVLPVSVCYINGNQRKSLTPILTSVFQTHKLQSARLIATHSALLDELVLHLSLCFLFNDEPRRICFMLIHSKIIQRTQRRVYKALHLTMEKKNIMMGSLHKECFYKETMKEKENAICFGRLINRQVEYSHIKACAKQQLYKRDGWKRNLSLFCLSIE